MGFSFKSLAKGGAVFGKGGISDALGVNFEDILFGKKSGGVSRSSLAAQAEALQKKTFELQGKGLGALEKQFGDTEGFIRKQQAQAGKQAITSAADQQRALQGRIARRGLGGSSVGLGAQTGIDLSLAQRKGAISASAPELRRQAISGLLGQAGQVGSTLNVPIAFRNIKATRKGGLAQVALQAGGAAIGGSLGGPAGAQAGAAAGGAIGQSFTG